MTAKKEVCLACEIGDTAPCKEYVNDDTELCASCHHCLECHDLEAR